MYKSYISTHLYKWVRFDNPFEVSDTCFERAVIGNHVRLCNYMVRKTSLLSQPSQLAQKLEPGQPDTTHLKSITKGAYNLFYDVAYKKNDNFLEADTSRDIPYRNPNEKVIKVRRLILQIVARYGTSKLVRLMPIDFRDNLVDVFGAIAMGVFRENVDVLRAIVAKYGWISSSRLVGYARTLGMVRWLRNMIPVPKRPDSGAMTGIIEKFCEHDADEVLHEYAKELFRTRTYLGFRRNVLEISAMDGAEKIMKRYIVDAPEDVVKNTILRSLTSPNICTEWLWEHKHTTFKKLMKTSLMEDTLGEYRLEGVIWLMEHGLILTERQMSYIDEVEEDHEDTPEYHTSLVNKIKELYAAQNK